MVRFTKKVQDIGINFQRHEDTGTMYVSHQFVRPIRWIRVRNVSTWWIAKPSSELSFCGYPCAFRDWNQKDTWEVVPSSLTEAGTIECRKLSEHSR